MYRPLFRFLVSGMLAVLFFAFAQTTQAATTVNGKLTTPTGTAVSGASITLRDSGWSIYNWATTATDGSFSFSNVPSCSSCILQVWANNTEYADPDDRTVNVTGTTLDLGTITLANHNVIGKLTLPDGTTAATSISMAFQSSDYVIYRWYNTDTSGNFRFRVPSSGTYTLKVYSDYTATDGTKYYAPADASVTVTDPAATLDLGVVKMKNPNVTGKAMDGSTAISSASFTARTDNWSFSRWTTSSSTGDFGFYLPAGTYTLETYLPWSTYGSGRNPDPRSFTVTEGQTTDLGTIGPVTANFFLKLTKSDGTTAIKDASVTVRTSDWKISKYGTTDSNGAVSVALTTAATYTVEIWTYNIDESRPDNFTFTYTSGNVYYDGTNSSSVVRTQGPAMRGKVTKSDGTAIQSASVSLYDSSYMNSRWASTNSSGEFTIDSVPTGTYTLEVSPPWDATDLVGTDKISISLTKGQTNETYKTSPLVLATAKKTISGKVTRENNGSAVTNAYVNAWRTDGSGWRSAETDANGKYSMTVGKGTWSVTTYPKWESGKTPDWSYSGKSPTTATFSEANTVTESKSVDFAVESFTATIKGKVRNPDDTVPSGSYNSVSIWRQDGSGNWATLDSDGAFSVKVAPGTYNINIYVSNNTYASPEIAPQSVKDEETKDIGTIKLLEKKEVITGTVADSNGKGIASQNVNCWAKRTYGWASGTTDSNGKYTLNVSAGTWVCNAYTTYYGYGQGSDKTKYTADQEPTELIVLQNETKTLNFTFRINDATIKGSVKKEGSDDILTDVNGWVNAQLTSSTATWSNLGGEVSAGKFEISVPAGTYKLGMWQSYGSNYSAKSETDVTVASGETKTDAIIRMIANDATISGTLRDSAGNAITDITGSVNANCGPSSYQWSSITNGTYSLKVPRGTCTIDYWVDTRQNWYKKPLENDGKVEVSAGETKTYDLTLQKLDAKVSGTAYDPDGKPLANARISVDTTLGGKTKKSSVYDLYGSSFELGASTDSDGNFSINVPEGSYFVTATYATSFGYINPRAKEVEVSPSASASLTFKFLKPDATVTGTVYLGGATATSFRQFRALSASTSPALVTGWSDEGGLVSQFTENGSFTLNVTKKDAWHLSASYTSGTTIYKSPEYVVTVGDTGTATQDITMEQKKVALPEPETKTFPSNVTTIVELDNDATVTIPANSVPSNDVVNVTVTATPDAQLPEEADTKLLDFGYDLEMTYASGTNAGQTVNTFTQDLTVTLPYTDAQLTDANVSEDELSVKYYDETAGSWQQTETAFPDTVNNAITVNTDHFTSFALVTAAATAVAPTIELTGPENGKVVKQDSVTLSGSVTDAKATITYSLNSGTAQSITPRSDGSFTATVTGLAVGNNTLTVEASNSAGTATPVSRSITYTPSVSASVKTLRVVVSAQSATGPQIFVLDAKGKVVKKFFVFAKSLRANVKTIIADMNDDGTDEIVAYATTGVPRVRVYSLTGKLLARFNAYKQTLTTGISLIVADLDGNGKKEIIAAPAKGEVPEVRIYSMNGKLVKKFVVGVKSSRGGLNLTSGDLDGDKRAELFITNQSSGNSAVRIYTIDGKQTSVFYLFGKKAVGGYNVTAADTNGDGNDELVAATSASAELRLYSPKGKLQKKWTAFPKTYTGGVSVSAGDLTGDGKDEIVVTAASRSTAAVRVYSGNGKLVSNMAAFSKKTLGTFTTLLVDTNDDAKAEIIVAPGAGVRQPIRVLSNKGKVKANWTPYGKTFRGGYNVSANK